MRTPLRHVAGHLLWSPSGGVWAVWRVEPLAGGYLPAQVRRELLGRITSLVRSMPGLQPRVFALAARIDPGEVAERMVDGLDWERLPEWAEVCAAGVDLLDGREIHERTVWLAVPLPGRAGAAATVLGAMYAEAAAALGLAPVAVPVGEVRAARGEAARLQASLGGGMCLRPASPAEIVWMVQHAVHRGLAEEPLLSDAQASPLYGSRVHDGQLLSPSYADLGQVRLAEGGQDQQTAGTSGRGRGPWWRSAAAVSPLGRLWLQTESEAGTGYQAQLVLAELPPAVATEAADVLAQLEGLPFPVDVTVDLRIVPAKKARAQVQRKKRELLDQAGQYGAQPTGMPYSLPEAAGDLEEQDARMAQTSVEVEVQSVTVLTVWGPDAVTCDARARELSSALAAGDYRAVRPIGMQEDLFTLGLPGGVRAPKLTQFTQHQLSQDWAACGALTLPRVGDPSGILIGRDLDSGTLRPVLLNPADAPQVNASASSAVIGDLGAGKSVLQKLVTGAVVDQGGQAIVIDRTPVREWANFARTAMGQRCQIIDAAQAQVSVDPLRAFGGAVGAHYALSYLTLQLGVGPMTAAGAVLHHAVEEVSAGPDPSMGKVLDALVRIAAGEGARADVAATMADLLRIVASNPLAAMVFDPDLPVVSLAGDLGADMVVVTTAGLTLPPREAFADMEVLRQQPLESLIGRAVLYLLAAIARQAAFTDPERFCLVSLDEVYWLTSSAEGSALVHEILHDGRKHGAGVFLGAHNRRELGQDAGLIAYRYLARTSDRTSAIEGLRFLGLDGDDEDLLRLVTTGLSPVGQAGREGEMLLRDPRMQVGRIQVIVPDVQRLRAGLFTTPGRGRTGVTTGAGGAQ
ncbi:ATP-binding protein [Streptomyces sp. NBC_00536]|uniref:ATP-binding protein n=1 Tax=Streptomyces sp. NBC_00536 TaxID=2975769 RepID=UPI002E80846E|nr:ATP-binding protein [Streptomyces sp. NBC_00536]WUC84048.1 ATP-binding protein [Streptomyces sp. NBC_00536]